MISQDPRIDSLSVIQLVFTYALKQLSDGVSVKSSKV